MGIRCHLAAQLRISSKTMKIRTRFIITIIWLGIAGTGAALSSLAGMFLYLSPKLPSVESISDLPLETPLRIYSSDNKLIGEIGEKRRTPLTIQQIPQDLVNAIIATEDEEFYEHTGVSVKGIMRAVVHIIKTGRKGPGGSTITMQITRNVFLHLRQEFTRKFNEIILARKIEKELNKDQIMELYCNLMFLGKRAYGVEAAAQVYYGKSIDELDLAQLAMITGVFQGPSFQNPINNPERAIERRNYVLGRMLKVGFIDEQRYEEAINQPITASQHGKSLDLSAPFVAEMARAEAIERFGQNAYKDGYEIYTTVNSELQNTAQKSVIQGLMEYDSRHGYRGPEQTFDPATLVTETDEEGNESVDHSAWLENLQSVPVYAGLTPAVVTDVSEESATALLPDGSTVELTHEEQISKIRPYVNENVRNPAPKTPEELFQAGDIIRLVKDDQDQWQLTQVPKAQAALISLSPDNGAILALVGGLDFNYSNFNRVTQAERQPGSNFKPFIYTTALEQGMTPATIINDAPVVFEYDEELERDWRPDNDNSTHLGPTRLRKALYRSTNLVSIRVLRSIGIQTTVNNLGKFGFDEEKLPKDLTLALGSHSVTPLELVSGYAVFANGGYQVKPWLIDRIVNADGEIVYRSLPMTVCKDCEHPEPNSVEDEIARAEEMTTDSENSENIDEPDTFAPLASNLEPENNDEVSEEEKTVFEEMPNLPYEFLGDPFQISLQLKTLLNILEPEDYPKAPKVLSDQVAFIIDSMLRDVVRYGTGRRARELGRSDLAGKTGTTNGPKDAWFSGYNGEIVTTAWVGFDQYEPLGNREYGGTAALPIWMDFMKVALAGKPETVRLQPPGVVTVKIDPETGERARIDDPDAMEEYFRTENVPPLTDTGTDSSDPYSDEARSMDDLF